MPNTIGLYFGRDANGVFYHRMTGGTHPGVPVINGEPVVGNVQRVMLFYDSYEVWVYWVESEVRGETALLLVEHMWRQGDLLPERG